MPKEMQNAMSWLFSGFVASGISYFWIDKPVAFWVFSNQLNHIHWLKQATFLPIFVVGFAVLAYLGLTIRFCQEKFGAFEKGTLLVVNTIAITYFLKSILKILFGRYWPLTWIHHNPSLIRDGVYGFNWFHTGSMYGAFPSGHSAVMAAGMVALGLNFPKWSGLFFLLWLLVAIGLVGTNSHFVSDVISGGALGGVLACSVLYTLNHCWYKKSEQGL